MSSTSTTIDRAAGALARGAVAGAVGTAAMTVSSTLEAKLRDRGASSTPAEAAGTVLGVEPADQAGEQRFNQIVHWAYGTALGTLRGALDVAGLHGVPATGVHLGTVLAAEQISLPATGAAPPATEWGAPEIATDLLHHVVYAAATGFAYDALRRW